MSARDIRVNSETMQVLKYSNIQNTEPNFEYVIR